MRRRHLVAALLFALATVVVLWQLGDQGRSATLLRVVSLFVDSTGEPTGALDLLAVPLFLLLGALLRLLRCADVDGTRRTSGATAAGAAMLLLPPSPVAPMLAAAAGVRVAELYAGLLLPLLATALAWAVLPWGYTAVRAVGDRIGARVCGGAHAHGRMTQSGKGAPVPAAASDAGGTGRVVLALFDAALRAGDVRIRRSALRTLAAIAMPVILCGGAAAVVWHVATLPVAPVAGASTLAAGVTEDPSAAWVDPLPPLREPPGAESVAAPGTAPVTASATAAASGAGAGAAPGARTPAPEAVARRAGGSGRVAGSGAGERGPAATGAGVPPPPSLPPEMAPDESEEFLRLFPLGVQEPPGAEREPAPQPAGGLSEPPTPAAGTGAGASASAATESIVQPIQEPPGAQSTLRAPTPVWFWWLLAATAALLGGFYLRLDVATIEHLADAARTLTTPRMFVAAGLLLAVVFADVAVWVAAGVMLLVVGAWAAVRGRAGLRAIAQRVVAPAAKGSAVLCGVLLLATLSATVFAQFGGHGVLVRGVLERDATGALFMPLAMIIVILFGCLMRPALAVAVFVPFVAPMLPRFDVDPLHMALLIAMCMQIAALLMPRPLPTATRRATVPPDRRRWCATLDALRHPSGGRRGRGGVVPMLVLQTVVGVSLLLMPEFGLWLPRLLLP